MTKKLISFLLAVVLVLTGFVLPIAQPVFASGAGSAEAYAASMEELPESSGYQLDDIAQGTANGLIQPEAGAWSAESLAHPAYNLSGVGAGTGAKLELPADPSAKLPSGMTLETSATETSASLNALAELNEAHSALVSAVKSLFPSWNSKNSADLQPSVFSADSSIAADPGKELKATTAEEYEKLLAEQKEPSEEFLESLVLSREDNGEQHRVVYSLAPVRYRNAEGEWELIDLSITVSNTKDGKRVIESGKSDVRVGFHEEAANTGLVSLEKDGTVIAFAPVGSDDRLSTKTNSLVLVRDGSAARETAEKAGVNTRYSSALYQNAFSGTDLIYTPTGSGVKEELVLNSAPKQTEFRFLLDAGGLEPLLMEDGAVCLVDPETRQITAELTAPYMYDSAENEDACSYDVRVKLYALDNGAYLYCLIPDEGWLNARERVYPVYLDPTVTFTSSSYIGDTYVDTHYKNKTRHTEDKLKCGTDASKYTYRPYIDLTAAVSQLTQNNVTVNSASLILYEDYKGNSYPVVMMYQVNAPITFSTLTWNTQPAWSATSTNFTLLSSQTVKEMGPYTWDLTETLQAWINDSTMQRILMWKIQKESNNQYKRFTPTEHAATEQWPKLVVEYTTVPNAPAEASLSYTVNAANSTKADLQAAWSAVSDATGYTAALYQKVSGAWTKKSEQSVTATGCTFAAVSDSAQYCVRIWASNSLGLSTGYTETNSVTTPDLTPPTAPSSVTVTPTGWTNGAITVTHTAAADVSSVSYQYAVTANTSKPAESAYKALPSNTALTHSVTPAASPSTGYVWVRAVDAAGNKGEPTRASQPYKYSKTAPTFSTLTMVLSDEGYYTITADFTSTTDSTVDWVMSYHIGTGSATDEVQIASSRSNKGRVQGTWTPPASLPNNTVYTLTMTLTDLAGNKVSRSVTFVKADGSRRVPAALKLDSLEPLNNDSSYNVWKAVYSKADASDSNSYSNAKLVVDNVAMSGLTYTVPLATTPEGLIKYAYVKATDQNSEPAYSCDTFEKQKVYLSENGQNDYTLSGLTLSGGKVSGSGTLLTTAETLPGTVAFLDLVVNQTVPSGASVSYRASFDGGKTWKVVTPVSTNGGVTVNKANRLYVDGANTGSSVQIKAILSKGSASSAPSVSHIAAAVRYLFNSTGEVINTSFEPSARGITQLVNAVVTDEGLSLTNGSASGSVVSTTRRLSADATAYRLIADATVPSGASILYLLSVDGGLTWSQAATVPQNDNASYLALPKQGRELVLKAVLKPNAAGASPVLRSWNLEVEALMPGEACEVSLIDPPDHLSTLSNANHMTLLRWSPSATSGVTYNVYRSETPYFTPSEDSLAASGITGSYWYDYNLNCGQTYYYFVAAVKDDRLSLYTNQAAGTAADSNELDKHLGLQNYWSFAQFDTVSGAGYVNVSNGNLVYQSSDLLISDPFFAMVMRRTYNSQAASKTALGLGWDFSFNTTLMREYGEGNSEVDMVLKDGDGSLHRFAYNAANGSYSSAPGTRMTLVHDTANGEYVITRKDNIVYHFDDQSLQLERFTDLGGAELTFEYDERGNLSQVINSVGDRLEFTYKVWRTGANANSAVPTRSLPANDNDYYYVNEHIDMLTSVKWTSQDGTAKLQYTYTYDANDRLIKAATTLEGNKSYTETFTYGADGRMASITNPDTRPYAFAYDGQGRCTGITYPGSLEATLFEYSAASTTVKSKVSTSEPYTAAVYEFDAATGVVTKTIDAKGHPVNYSYTSDLLPATVSYTNYVNGVLTDKPITQTFTYDASTRDLTICNVTYNGQKLAETRYESYICNQPGRVKVLNKGSYVTTTYTYNAAGQVLTVKDPTGKTATNSYNNQGWLSWTRDRNGAYVFYDYDSKGRVTAVYNANVGYKAQAFCVTRYTYDAYGRTATVSTDGMNDTTTFTYSKDVLGVLTSRTYANGAKETFTYKVGLLLTATDPDGVVTSYAYDRMSRLIKQTVTAGEYSAVTTYSYGAKTAYGVRRVIVTDPEKRTSTVWYDETGRAVRQQSGGVTYGYAYDLMGRQTMSVAYGKSGSLTNARMTRVEYDAAGNQTLSAAVHADNMSLVGSNGEKLAGYTVSKDLVTTKTFDNLGNVLSATDGNGVTINYTYDVLSRLTSVTQPLNATQTAVTAYQYDVAANGNLKNVTTSANGTTTETVFDLSGRLLSKTAANTVTTSYEYDAKGRTVKVTRPDGTEIRYEYDCVGNVLSEKYYDVGAASPGLASTYTYNAKGTRLLKVAQNDGSTVNTLSYTYDALGRVTQQRQELGANGVGALSVNYRYNLTGQVTAVGYPISSANGGPDAGTMCILRYVYGSSGRIYKIYLDSGSFDSDTLSENAKLIRTYDYCYSGQLYTTTENPNVFEGGTLSRQVRYYTYDSFGRVATLLYSDMLEGGTSTTREKTTFTYDKCGNILTENKTESYGTSKTVNKTYTYDLAGRMTKAVIDGAETSYTYDLVGNRLTRSAKEKNSSAVKTTSYTYDALNRLSSSTLDGAVTAYTYDARGNQLTEITTGKNNAYTAAKNLAYDLADRLSSFTSDYKQGSTTTRLNTSSYAYNALDQRVTRVENEVITHFYYSGGALLYTTENEYLLRTQNILTPGGEIIASKRFEGASAEQMYANQYFYYRYDIRGSVTNIVDTSGAVVKSYTYDEFGNTTASDSSFHNDVTYTGSIADASGLQYMNARYYNPETARFITQDSYTGTASEPWTQHLYAYCANNPVNMTDPTGHSMVAVNMADGGGSGSSTGEPDDEKDWKYGISPEEYEQRRLAAEAMAEWNKIRRFLSKTDDAMAEEIRTITHSDKYSQKVWNGLNNDERWNRLIEYQREVTRAMGLPSIETKDIKEMPNYKMYEELGIADDICGGYCHEERTLYLNKSSKYLSDRNEILDTVRHEMRHYYQDMLCDYAPTTYIYRDRTVIDNWIFNRNHYQGPEKGAIYFLQHIERDAYDWAAKTG